MFAYIKQKQKQLEKKARRAAELEAIEEAARVAKMEAEARKQEEIVARKKLLREQQESERRHQKHIQRKEKLAEQNWNKQVDTLLVQIKDRFQKDNKLEEIRIILQNREPSLQQLDWISWLAVPLNQQLANLDFLTCVKNLLTPKLSLWSLISEISLKRELRFSQNQFYEHIDHKLPKLLLALHCRYA